MKYHLAKQESVTDTCCQTEEKKSLLICLTARLL